MTTLRSNTVNQVKVKYTHFAKETFHVNYFHIVLNNWSSSYLRMASRWKYFSTVEFLSYQYLTSLINFTNLNKLPLCSKSEQISYGVKLFQQG